MRAADCVLTGRYRTFYPASLGNIDKIDVNTLSIFRYSGSFSIINQTGAYGRAIGASHRQDPKFCLCGFGERVGQLPNDSPQLGLTGRTSGTGDTKAHGRAGERCLLAPRLRNRRGQQSTNLEGHLQVTRIPAQWRCWRNARRPLAPADRSDRSHAGYGAHPTAVGIILGRTLRSPSALTTTCCS